jgi:hypothetical protein
MSPLHTLTKITYPLPRYHNITYSKEITTNFKNSRFEDAGLLEYVAASFGKWFTKF